MCQRGGGSFPPIFLDFDTCLQTNVQDQSSNNDSKQLFDLIFPWKNGIKIRIFLKFKL